MAAFSQQLDPLVVGRRAPTFTPVGGGGIIARLKGFQVISEAVEAEIRLATILCEQVIVAIAVFIYRCSNYRYLSALFRPKQSNHRIDRG